MSAAELERRLTELHAARHTVQSRVEYARLYVEWLQVRGQLVLTEKT